ncbi:hypothetical protein [Sphingopyxis lindanitolerans]|nr:hypothetical protein [Sphingopyxis lindanitolerans]
MMRLLDVVHTMGLGAALAFSYLHFVRGLDVGGELAAANLLWVGAYFAQLAVKKGSKVSAHG